MLVFTSPFRVEYEDGVLYVDGEKMTPAIRKIGDLKPVLYQPDIADQYPDEPAYYMFRSAVNKEWKEKLEKAGLRYDITVIPPRMLGEEFIKTAGHFHPEAKPGLSYTEVYGVIKGTAEYLLQTREGDVVLVVSPPGAKVVIPPNYGHVTINSRNDILIMENLVSPAFSSDYSLYRKLKGAAYYKLKTGFVRNPNYKRVTEIKEKKPDRITEKNLLKMFEEDPSWFDHLKDPSLYIKLIQKK